MNLRGSTLTRGRIDSLCLRQDGLSVSLFEWWDEDKTREATFFFCLCVSTLKSPFSREAGGAGGGAPPLGGPGPQEDCTLRSLLLRINKSLSFPTQGAHEVGVAL